MRMIKLLYASRPIRKILRDRRRRRAEFVLSKVATSPGTSILDIGCGPNGRSFEDFIDESFKVTGIDLLDEDEVRMAHPGFTYIKQDARDFGRFRDGEFDLVVSFGMMEHICDRSVLRAMASEIARLSGQWAIVVPWKYAFIEPHFKFPFFQLLPYPLKVFLTRALNLHDLGDKDYDYIRTHYQWLPNREWKEIFQASGVYVMPSLDAIAIVRSECSR